MPWLTQSPPSSRRPTPRRTHPRAYSLATVPSPDEPELPIPSPAGAPAPAMTLIASAETPWRRRSVDPAARPAPPPDPLAALMALSEDERLALFT